jgi:predicted DNA-binding transcriptional regulator AlpA
MDIVLSDLDQETEFLSVEEARCLLRCGRNTLYEAIQRDEVPGVLRIGKRIFICKKALYKAAMMNLVKPNPESIDHRN